jgi:beta-glucosidase
MRARRAGGRPARGVAGAGRSPGNASREAVGCHRAANAALEGGSTMRFAFPQGFVWGAATAAHQVEGNNTASDFWLLEHVPGTAFAEPSGDACDQWHRYPDDVALLARLGFGAYRLSIEWARIEPAEGCFSLAALDHYRRVLAACHERGVAPCVTFHHFTSPLWVAADGGWESEKTADRFARFCERAVAHLGDLVAIACTINEANLPVSLALAGTLPRQGPKRLLPFVAEAARRCGSDLDRFAPFLLSDPFRTRDVLLAAHRRARDVLKAGRGDFPVGVTLAMQDCVAAPGGDAKLAEARRESFDPFLDAAREGDDFVGVQTYSRTRFGPDGALPPEPGVPVLVMGYEFWPQALEGTLRYAARAGVPLLVTENGIGTDDDAQRVAYYREALAALVRCLEDGIDVRGYFAWSLLDNYEWLHGYRPRFGLVAVDRETQARTPKPSAALLGRVARENAFDPDAFG